MALILLCFERLPVVGVRPLAPTLVATTLHEVLPRTCCEGEGSDPFSPDPVEPTALASQRIIPLEGWGEEEQSARAAPDDLLTSYPGTGRKSALLGRVRTCQGAC